MTNAKEGRETNAKPATLACRKRGKGKSKKKGRGREGGVESGSERSGMEWWWEWRKEKKTGKLSEYQTGEVY